MKSKDSVKDIICFIAVCAVLVFLLITQIYENDGRTRVAVHIKGEVVSPGYYELKDGARLNDAIKNTEQKNRGLLLKKRDLMPLTFLLKICQKIIILF